MTAIVARRETWAVLAVLRRGELDARDAAIVRAVARGAKRLRDIGPMVPLSLNTIWTRVVGRHGPWRSRLTPGLLERGWLQVEAGRHGTLRPGPRFAGLDGDWPLEVVRE